MTTAIVRRELTPDVWGVIEKVAPTMFKSRLFGVSTTEQASAIMLKGYELGLGLSASFDFINIIGDKPALNPRGALALILQSGECSGLKIEDQSDDKGIPTACQVTMKRKNGVEYTARFTMEDAKRADLIKPGSGWAKYPSNMLRWRSLGYCADIVFPDITGGMKRADEFGAAISPEGDVISTSWKVVENTPKTTAAELEQSLVANAINELVTQYSPEVFLEVTSGNLPTTLAETTELVEKLKAKQAERLNFNLNDLPKTKPA